MRKIALILLAMLFARIALADSRVLSFDDTALSTWDVLKYDGTDFGDVDFKSQLANANLDDFPEVSGWTDYSGSASTGCGGGSCTGWTATVTEYYAKNHEGLCYLFFEGSGTVATGNADWLTVTAPWANYNNPSSYYTQCGSNNTHLDEAGHVYIGDNSTTIYVYRENLSQYVGGLSATVKFNCVYRCDYP